jgi:hypothetical protein
VARRWTGNRWQNFTLPAGFSAEESGEMVPDSRGRIWFLPKTKEGPAMYFDPRTKKGRRFGNIHAAFQGLADDPPQFLNTWPSDAQWRPHRASFHQGRVAFRSASQTLEYFDGTKWHSWKPRDIVLHAQGMGQPYFDRQGELRVTIREGGWTWDGAAWKQIPGDPGYPDPSFAGIDSDIVLPDGIENSGSIARDNKGTIWYTRDGMLFSLNDGVETAAFDPGEIHPFGTGCSPHLAIVDRTGHTFFSTVPGRTGWFVVCPRNENSHARKPAEEPKSAQPEPASP